jgi:serine/threonine-protein kinase
VAARLVRDEPLGLDLPRDGDGRAFGRYELRGLLGRGSYGAVYEAFDHFRGGPVALKVLAPSVEDGSELARFVREAQVHSRVDDPHVVAMLDAEVVEGRAFCAMRLVRGPTLQTRLQAEGALSEEQALPLLWGVLRALQALAREGIVHRDLSPRNVLLADGRPSRPVLIDFGLAKAPVDVNLTGTDVLLGTAGYIAPEVVDGLPADTRSDLFSAGILAIHALLGAHPLAGLRGMALLRAMAERPVEVPPWLSSGTRALLASLIDLDPDRRPASPTAALLALGRAAQDLTAPRLQRPPEVSDPAPSGV